MNIEDKLKLTQNLVTVARYMIEIKEGSCWEEAAWAGEVDTSLLRKAEEAKNRAFNEYLRKNVNL